MDAKKPAIELGNRSRALTKEELTTSHDHCNKMHTKSHGEARREREWRTPVECPVCGSTKKKCRVSSDGEIGYCRYLPGKYPPNSTGLYWHNLKSVFWDRGENKRPSRIPVVEIIRKSSFTPRAFAKSQSDSEKAFKKGLLDSWAKLRGVTVKSLRRLGVEAVTEEGKVPEHIKTPERNKRGFVIGEERRYLHPIEVRGELLRFLYSGKRAFKFADDWSKTHNNTLLICEGLFDTASSMDAGFSSIGRYSRDAKLNQIENMVRGFEGEVYLICENDKEGSKQEKIRSVIASRADELSELTGRKVRVASPPTVFNDQKIKDINDWWRAITDGMGHEMEAKARYKLGFQMLEHLQADSYRDAIAKNVTAAQRIAEILELEAEVRRAEKQDSFGRDTDFEDVPSCAFHKVLVKPAESSSDDSLKASVMGARLGCKAWSCDRCFVRIVAPEWKTALIHGFSRCIRVAKKVLPTRERAEQELAKIKKQSPTWALFSTRNDDGAEFVLFTSAEMPGKVNDLFSIGDEPEEFQRLADTLCHYVEMVDREVGRPIRTSRGIRRTEEVTVDDWSRKFNKIVEHSSELYEGLLDVSQVAELKKAAKEKPDSRDYLIVEREGKHVAFSNFEFEPLHLLHKKSGSSFSIALKDLDAIQCTPRWRAQHTAGWIPANRYATPEEVKQAAVNMGERSMPVDFGPLAGIVKAELVRLSPSKVETFLEHLD